MRSKGEGSCAMGAVMGRGEAPQGLDLVDDATVTHARGWHVLVGCGVHFVCQWEAFLHSSPRFP